MKKLLVVIALFLSAPLYAQHDIASWNISVQPAGNDNILGEKDLVFSARLDKSWNVYASNFSAPIGPLPTAIDLKPDTSYEIVGSLESDKPKEATDPAWSITYTYFSGQAEFRQRIKIKKGKTHIRGVIKGQYINRTNNHLQDFEEPFDLFVP
jgi:thiol:disulfide interchange protein DsbD